MTPIVQTFIAFLLGSVIVWYAIPVVVRVSKAKQLLDEPNERKVNKTVIPNLGGIALFISISIVILLRFDRSSFADFRFILAGMILLFFIGIKDDLLVISPRKKFLAQVLSAFVLVGIGDIRLTDFHGILGLHEIPYAWSVFISVLGVVSIVNAFNLIDGIDGLAASIGMVATTIFGRAFFLNDHLPYAILSFGITGSLLSFFMYNVFGNKNKIFMGDTGSLIIGFLLATLAIKYNEFALDRPMMIRNLSPVISIAVLIVPLFDMIRVFGLRLMRGKSPFYPDMNHIHHKLLKLGFSHLKSTSLIIGVNLLMVGIIFLFADLNVHILLLLLFSMAAFFTLLPGYFLERKTHGKGASIHFVLDFILVPFRNQEKTKVGSKDSKKVVGGKKIENLPKNGKHSGGNQGEHSKQKQTPIGV